MSRRPSPQRRLESENFDEFIWIGGIHAVEETLSSRAQDISQLCFESGASSPVFNEMIRRARKLKIVTRFKSKDEISRLTGEERHQGAAARVRAGPPGSFLDFLDGLDDAPQEKRKDWVFVALDQIQDPHNFGAIARSASALGARGLVIPDRRSASVSSGSMRSSAGAIQKIPIYQAPNLSQALLRAKERGFWIYGAAAEGRKVWESALNFPMILAIGSEGEGLRPSTRNLCDEVVGIPMPEGGVSSLNASVAAGILLYETLRRQEAR